MDVSSADAGDALARRLGPGDAVLIGLGSMLGAGVFTVFAPAAGVAGSALLAAILLAAAVAWCNAMSSARLAAAHPQSGGSYLYGRRQLGPVCGFLAGWAFLVGKTASCVAMALAFGAYVWPQRPELAAVAVVSSVTVVNLLGITRTAAINRILVGVTLTALAAVVVAIFVAGQPDPERLGDGWDAGALGVAQAAGLLFFAFAGYARITTLGEEVRDPARTIPRAVTRALAVVVVIYLLVGTALLLALGPTTLAGSSAPLADAVTAGSWSWLGPLVRVGAAMACAGVLLSLMAGVGRTTLAMARDREVPGFLGAVHPVRRVPHRAEAILGGLVAIGVFAADLPAAIGLSSFAVLVYYAVANASALTLRTADRRRVQVTAVLGLIGCLALAGSLPLHAVAAGVLVLALGVAGRFLRGRSADRRPDRHRT